MSTTIKALGTLLKIGDAASPEVFTTIAEVLDGSGPELSADLADTTNQSSTGGYEEALPTVLRTGEVTFEINFDPVENTHDEGAGLLKDLKNRTKRNFQLVFPDAGGTTWTVAAFVTRFQPLWSLSDQLKAAVSLKVTGDPTLA